MVFEEFFLKKKIDLAQLKDADPDLFEQFKSHYSLMSEKSFDHTKKYWFNKLRHKYPLSIEEEARLKELFKGDKNVLKPEALIETPSTEVAVAKPAGFRPKFKAPVASSTNAEENKTEETIPSSDSTIAKPPGFKPRFKAGATPTTQAEPNKDEELLPKKIDQDQEKETASETKKPDATPKPLGFKPRFKAGATPATQAEPNKDEELPPKKIDQDQEKETASETNTLNAAPKPLGFKPRFKAGTTPKTQAEPNQDEELPPKKIDQDQEKETASETKTSDAAPKPLGFKPRFKAGATPATPTESNKDEELPPKKIDQDQEKETASETKTSDAAPKPLGFKPRFKKSSE